MDATESPGDLLATGWAARAALGTDPCDPVARVAAALPQAWVRRLAAQVELARQLTVAEMERDAAWRDNARLRAALAERADTIEWLRGRQAPPAGPDGSARRWGGRWRPWYRREDGSRWAP